MRFVHPISMLSFGARRLPPDFSLEAADCLTLYHALESVREKLDFDFGRLYPKVFFADRKSALLTQKDILSYEAALTTRVSDLIDSTDPQDQQSTLRQIIQDLSDPFVAKADEGFVPSADAFFHNLITLVSDLPASGDLVSSPKRMYRSIVLVFLTTVGS